MSLAAGHRLDPYEIRAPLGAGGMGEVYRAHDTRLQRDVAIKILPDSFAADPERLVRFEREAHALAALNHPHIAQIFGLEIGTADAEPRRALVMELVEGEDLSRRIGRGPIAVEDALRLAKQSRSTRGRPRPQHHPSRSEAGERQGSRRWGGEGPRLRARQAVDGRGGHR